MYVSVIALLWISLSWLLLYALMFVLFVLVCFYSFYQNCFGAEVEENERESLRIRRNRNPMVNALRQIRDRTDNITGVQTYIDN